MLDYKTHSDSNSLYNTPPTFAIYMASLVFEWLKELGGVKKMEELNREKAAILYGYLEQSKLFSSPVEKESRSLMNIPFATSTAALDAEFLAKAQAAGLVTLKGHRSVGGMRASIYNAMPVEGVKRLVEVMEIFENSHKVNV